MTNTEIESHELLDTEQIKICKVFRNESRKSGAAFTMLDFARIALRASGVNYTNAEDDTTGKLMADRDLQRAAVLFTYEALKASEEAIIAEATDKPGALELLEWLARDL